MGMKLIKSTTCLRQQLVHSHSYTCEANLNLIINTHTKKQQLSQKDDTVDSHGQEKKKSIDVTDVTLFDDIMHP